MTTSSSAESQGSFRRKLAHWRAQIAHAVLLPDLSGQPGSDLRATVYKEGQLTSGYVLMCALSAGIAILGLLQSSTAVVIGAMLISPLMAPIAALGFSFSSIDGHRIRDSFKVVAVGAAIGVTTAVLITLLSPIRNATPEILARTEPTLLDLAVALLSGIAGGYATVQQKGGTAIGVAIATALMPPLATVGYGLGVLRLDFAFGAMLLFLTNLAAIAFSFALIARLSGAARPLRHVEWTPGYIAAGVIAFMALALPLGLTLVRVTHEATARTAARNLIRTELSVTDNNITQLDVAWPLFGYPKVDAVVISSTYHSGAQAQVEDRLTAVLGKKATLSLQQVQAADLASQTRAMVDAAMERTVAGINNDNPPYAEIGAAIGAPVSSVWIDRVQRIVNVVPVPQAGWGLADYQDLERMANQRSGSWNVRVIPPYVQQMVVTSAADAAPTGTATAASAAWAAQRWGLGSVAIAVPATPANENTASEPAVLPPEADPLVAAFKAVSIEAVAVSSADRMPAPGQYRVSFAVTPPSRRVTGGD